MLYRWISPLLLCFFAIVTLMLTMITLERYFWEWGRVGRMRDYDVIYWNLKEHFLMFLSVQNAENKDSGSIAGLLTVPWILKIKTVKWHLLWREWQQVLSWSWSTNIEIQKSGLFYNCLLFILPHYFRWR